MCNNSSLNYNQIHQENCYTFPTRLPLVKMTTKRSRNNLFETLNCSIVYCSLLKHVWHVVYINIFTQFRFLQLHILSSSRHDIIKDVQLEDPGSCRCFATNYAVFTKKVPTRRWVSRFPTTKQAMEKNFLCFTADFNRANCDITNLSCLRTTTQNLPQNWKLKNPKNPQIDLDLASPFLHTETQVPELDILVTEAWVT